ncbi:MAG: hypothetical protein M1833_003964 [Piccolia ochrophora]|nr:MAG: hypothetical protein M1833_003964 [Piccolia ochrophora]
MPRSASDATRFTATGPHAHSYPSTSRSAPSSSSPASPQETPQQKVARLRAAAQKARLDKISTFDKVVVAGRTWADRVHRVAALSLIGATGICGVYATVCLTDMVLYNRRKRNEFYATQKALYPQRLAEAQEAAAKGEATEDQQILLVREEAATRYEEEQRNKKGVWEGVKAWMFEGLSLEERTAKGPLESDGEKSTTSFAQPGGLEGTTEQTVLGGNVTDAVPSLQVERKGGMLDRLGENVDGGWRSLFRGRGSGTKEGQGR